MIRTSSPPLVTMLRAVNATLLVFVGMVWLIGPIYAAMEKLGLEPGYACVPTGILVATVYFIVTQVTRDRKERARLREEARAERASGATTDAGPATIRRGTAWPAPHVLVVVYLLAIFVAVLAQRVAEWVWRTETGWRWLHLLYATIALLVFHGLLTDEGEAGHAKGRGQTGQQRFMVNCARLLVAGVALYVYIDFAMNLETPVFRALMWLAFGLFVLVTAVWREWDNKQFEARRVRFAQWRRAKKAEREARRKAKAQSRGDRARK